MISVLFVCLGNICRSPAAEATLRRLAQKQGVNLEVSSCGIGEWHLGDFADERMISAAKQRGIVIASRARQFKTSYLDQYDYIFASDHEIIEELYYYAKTTDQKHKIRLMSAYSPTYRGEPIPDPYYCGLDVFEEVLDMLHDCCEGFLEHITKRGRE